MNETNELFYATSRVPSNVAGELVVDYLARRFTYRSHAAWLAAVVTGEVSCNEVRCTPGTVVAGGDRVTCAIYLVDPPADYGYEIIYRDAQLLGIAKPAGLLVHARGRHARANLIYHLRRRHLPPYPTAQLVNRLDAETSGVVVVALDRLTLAALHRQWSAGAVLKEYRAVVHGAPQPASGIIELPLGATGARRRPVAVDLQTGRAAVTRYDTLAVDGNRTLLALILETGRTHQLRVHLAAIGHPIVGDWRYGPEEREAPRHWLHCLRTTLRHPQDDRTLVLEAPLPAAWPLRERVRFSI